MGTELYLKQITPDQLDHLHQHGLAGTLDDWYEEQTANPDTWLLLDEHILGFMDYELPQHPVLYRAVMGGAPFPDSAERGDYPRCFAPDDVKTMAQALSNVSDEEFRTRFDAARAIFGGVCIGGTDEQALARLQRRFREVVDHYTTAAQRSNAMLLLLF